MGAANPARNRRDSQIEVVREMEIAASEATARDAADAPGRPRRPRPVYDLLPPPAIRSCVGSLPVRIEAKYHVDPAIAYLIQQELRASGCGSDEHGDDVHGYVVSSIYPDDPGFGSYLDKVDGLARRIKYRLRFYSEEIGDTGIHLEHKEKDSQITWKRTHSFSYPEGPRIRDPVAGPVLELPRPTRRARGARDLRAVPPSRISQPGRRRAHQLRHTAALAGDRPIRRSLVGETCLRAAFRRPGDPGAEGAAGDPGIAGRLRPPLGPALAGDLEVRDLHRALE